MSARHRRYIVAYDIVDDTRRSRAARVLRGFGQRVQYSVFECVLDETEFLELWHELEDIVDPSEDSVRAYRLCAACVEWRKTLGQAVEVAIPDVFIA